MYSISKKNIEGNIIKLAEGINVANNQFPDDKKSCQEATLKEIKLFVSHFFNYEEEEQKKLSQKLLNNLSEMTGPSTIEKLINTIKKFCNKYLKTHFEIKDVAKYEKTEPAVRGNNVPNNKEEQKSSEAPNMSIPNQNIPIAPKLNLQNKKIAAPIPKQIGGHEKEKNLIKELKTKLEKIRERMDKATIVGLRLPEEDGKNLKDLSNKLKETSKLNAVDTTQKGIVEKKKIEPQGRK